MGQIAKIEPSRQQLIAVLQSSLYVGAKEESVDMVLSYCEAAGLDVMQKPVHIVPMNTKDPVSGSWGWRDVVMPGVGLYRIQADRAGTMAGISEAEYGPEVTKTFLDKNGNDVSMTFPEWCKIVARKLVGNHIVDFVAKEYWIENYATDSGKSDAPNAMWKKRPRGQLAKCAEAQALRKGWPEIGQSPTAEEMEGKILERDMGEAQVIDDKPKRLPDYPEEQFDKNISAWGDLIDGGKKTADQIIAMISSKYTLSDEQIATIKANPKTGEASEGGDFWEEYDKAQGKG